MFSNNERINKADRLAQTEQTVSWKPLIVVWTNLDNGFLPAQQRHWAVEPQ